MYPKKPKKKKLDKRVQKLIEEFEKIKPIYKKEDNEKYKKILRDRKLPKEIVKERAFKNSVKSFEVAIIEKRDPAKQLNYTRQYVILFHESHIFFCYSTSFI